MFVTEMQRAKMAKNKNIASNSATILVFSKHTLTFI